ncbi:MAG: peptide ABC transporter permease, partial [Octadecabacter sp.]|nr:peptide ABC transporter permease [Octadecabacter sp.]
MITNSDVEMLESTAHLAEVRGRSLWQDARVRFFRNKAAVAGLICLLAIALFAAFGGLFAQYEPDYVDFSLMGANAYQGVPSIATGHYFGTDIDGRDLFARTVQGTGISLMVG